MRFVEGPVSEEVGKMARLKAVYSCSPRFDESMVRAVHKVYGTKGIKGVEVTPSLDTINVEYDDGRLNAADVDRILLTAGLPVSRKV